MHLSTEFIIADDIFSEYMSVRIEIPVIKTDITIFLRCFISFLPIKYIKAYILIYIYIQEMSRL